MKAKTSVTLSKDLLIAIDRLAGSKSSRSAVIEQAVRSYLKERERAFVYARDLEILNRAADRLNAEAEETLEYQADPWRPEME
jgi:metal-responsive CopG/Arc/MetJ family transcriptional regulator